MICVVCQEDAWAEIGQVCTRCYGRMDGALRQIPRLLSEVSLERGRGTGQHVTGSREAPLPLLVDPLDLSMPVRPGSTGVRLRGAWSALGGDPDQIGHLSVATELDGYARMWAADRQEHGPHPQVPLLCPWLLDRLDWACESFRAIDEFASTLSRLYGALYAANGLGSPRPQVRDRACPRCGLLTLTLEPSGYTECNNLECRTMLTEDEYREYLRDLIANHPQEDAA